MSLRRRNLLILFISLGLLGALAAVRFTVVLNAPAARGKDVDSTEEMARRFHRGDGVCLRYLEGEIPDEDVDALTEVLLEAGVTPDELSAAVGLMKQWGTEREATMHALPEVDEWYEVLTEDMTPTARLLLWIKGEELLRENIEKATSFTPAVDPEDQTTWAQTAEVRRAVLRAQWERRPDVFAIGGGAIQLIEQLNRRITVQRLDVLVTAIRAHVRERGALPASLSELGISDESALLDGWHKPFEVDRIPGGLRVFSVRFDDEVPEREVLLSPEVDQPKVGCGPLPKRLTVSRAELEGSAGNTEPASQARITPVFSEGTARGVKLEGIRAGSLYERLGLCNGDVVTELLGLKLDSPEHLLEAYSRGQGASTVPMSIQRNGEEYQVTLVLE
ncbi:MAG: hypothetical protein WBV82_21480 [Myxococcaceae bacterium]